MSAEERTQWPRSWPSRAHQSRVGYFPGFYTATGHLIMSAFLIYLLAKESKRLRAEAESGVKIGPARRPAPEEPGSRSPR